MEWNLMTMDTSFHSFHGLNTDTNFDFIQDIKDHCQYVFSGVSHEEQAFEHFVNIIFPLYRLD